METAAVECQSWRRTRVSEYSEHDSAALLTAEFNRFYRTVYGYLVHRLFNRELAEELTAQTFSKAAAHISRLPGDAAFLRAWLLRTASNLANSHGRSRRRWWAMFDGLARTKASHWVADPPSDGTTAEASERLRGVLTTLAPNDQTVVVLRYYSQMSFEEIARVLQCRPDAVRARLSRAIKKMRCRLGVEDERSQLES